MSEMTEDGGLPKIIYKVGEKTGHKRFNGTTVSCWTIGLSRSAMWELVQVDGGWGSLELVTYVCWVSEVCIHFVFGLI
jgi:hypothetical protein